MTLSLSIVSIALGLCIAAAQCFGLSKPAAYSAALRAFPRSFPWGCALMLLGTGWFLYYLSLESISDFASYKSYLLVGFAAIGIGSCIFVRDFLAVRGLAVVMLLLGKLLVDTGRPFLPVTSWVLVVQVWAYVLIFFGMWLTISPWRLRDWVTWATANGDRLKMICAIRLAFGVLLISLGLTAFRVKG